MDLHGIRQEYSRQELSEQQCADRPLAQFEQWLQEAFAAQVAEPTAMALATANAHGAPGCRMVLLKETNAHGLVFFTNYAGRKGRELAENPQAAATFFWPDLERQVRFEGRVTQLEAHLSDEYFAGRPYTSRIGAWASEQSSVVSGKNEIVLRAAAFAAKHPLHVPRPPHWGGYLLLPETVEFWQGRPSRLHDRIRYRNDNGTWIKERLAP